MPLSLYQSSVGAFERSLTALLVLLDKAEAHAKARKFDPTNYLGMRLAPDMFPFVRQVQSLCDNAKNGVVAFRRASGAGVRGQGGDVRELRDRVGRTLDFLKTLDAKSIDAAGDREVVFPAGPGSSSGCRAETIWCIGFCRTSIST